MNIFQFKHVGKGLFYAGSINDEINFVYDCGTSYYENALKSEIVDGTIGAEKNIDFIIISNIKKDFINGLPDLYANYNIKKIYLPYLGDNKELIRFILFITIFRNTEINKNDLKLYSLMCKLYGVISHDFNIYEVPLPKVIFLGDPNISAESIYPYNGKVISRYENIENNIWKFIVINRTIDRESFKSAVENFNAAFGQFFCGDDFNRTKFERYLFMQGRTTGELEELRIKAKELFQCGIDISGVSENILIHYPIKPFYLMNLCEYNNYFDKSTATRLQPIRGTITLLLGDVQVDKTLEEHIFSTGNYSLCGGIFQIPYRYITEQNQNIISLARTFDDFVFAANTETGNTFTDSETIKKIRSVYKRIHISSPHKGIGYFVEPTKSIF